METLEIKTDPRSTPVIPESWRLTLSHDEAAAIRALQSDLTSRFRSPEDPAFLRELAVDSHELPRRVRKLLNDFRLQEPRSAICCISNYPLDDVKIGATPPHWKLKQGPSPTREEDMGLLLLGALLGEPIGWATQQDGHLVHDILPIKGHEQEQLGSGSEQLLWWHTEDAFHPYRGDYLGMMCMRNPEGVATTFASLAEVDLDPEDLRLLFEPRFTIRPDESHLKKNKSDLKRTDEELEASYLQIEKMNSAPEKIAIFSGAESSPYFRIDPYFMDELEDDPRAQAALDALITAIDGVLRDMVLNAGDVCFVDNMKAVHGRRPFKAHFDGTDRWLKRINIARDLRKSRAARPSAESRTIC